MSAVKVNKTSIKKENKQFWLKLGLEAADVLQEHVLREA